MKYKYCGVSVYKRFREKISYEKKYAWFLDQYKNPSETTHTYHEVLNWFKVENIEFLSSIPFDFNPENKLFQKREAKNRFEIFLNEISLFNEPTVFIFRV